MLLLLRNDLLKTVQFVLKFENLCGAVGAGGEFIFFKESHRTISSMNLEIETSKYKS